MLQSCCITTQISAFEFPTEWVKVFLFFFLHAGVTSWVKNWKLNGWRLKSGGQITNKDDFVKLDRLNGQVEVVWVSISVSLRTGSLDSCRSEVNNVFTFTAGVFLQSTAPCWGGDKSVHGLKNGHKGARRAQYSQTEQAAEQLSSEAKTVYIKGKVSVDYLD